MVAFWRFHEGLLVSGVPMSASLVETRGDSSHWPPQSNYQFATIATRARPHTHSSRPMSKRKAALTLGEEEENSDSDGEQGTSPAAAPVDQAAPAPAAPGVVAAAGQSNADDGGSGNSRADALGLASSAETPAAAAGEPSAPDGAASEQLGAPGVLVRPAPADTGRIRKLREKNESLRRGVVGRVAKCFTGLHKDIQTCSADLVKTRAVVDEVPRNLRGAHAELASFLEIMNGFEVLGSRAAPPLAAPPLAEATSAGAAASSAS